LEHHPLGPYQPGQAGEGISGHQRLAGRSVVVHGHGQAAHQFGELGKLVTVRCPREFDHLIRGAGGQWEPGTRQWLVERRRIGPVIRTLERVTDPLFRRAGLTLE